MLATIAVALSCMGCLDKTPTLAASPPDLPQLLGTVECSVDVSGARVVCTDPAPAAGGGPSLALLGQNQIKMRSANVVSDTAAQLFSMDATAQNLLSYAIGTPDGKFVTGLKVFFETGPTATAYYTPGDTGTVKVRNPDGYQNFTAAQQPYHFYDTILQPQEITRPKRWEFYVPRTVARFGFTVRVFTTTPRETRVEMTAPDHTPDRYSDPASIRFCNVSGFPECVFDAVVVGFRPAAAREERQSAIDLIGSLEGGMTELGLYYVRIPRDTTLARLRTALTALRNLPQVDYAYPYGELPGTTYYRRPEDGSGWDKWQLRDSLADGQNWAFEAISAPLAWGCETGNATAPVAIVDSDFHLVPDLAPNAVPMDSLVNRLTATADSLDHGTFTSSLFAAVGNNRSGMTGLAWDASLRLYEVARTDSTGIVRRNGHVVLNTARMTGQITRAARDGASVINLSMGIDWTVTARSFGWITSGTYNPAAETNPTRAATRDTIVAQLSALMVRAVDEATAAGADPLIIIAAGNDGIDAGWTGFAEAAHLRPRNVMIVGAGSRKAGARGLNSASFTNYGNLVQIAAPGDRVWALDRNGLRDGSGTSYAAPLVAATAGLLLSFDPRLRQQPDTLKALILQGAVNGGGWMRNGAGTDSIPGLNVYETLKAAARRPGAPLCGNRMWSDGRYLKVQRASGPETLDSLPTGYIRRFDAMHGGKRVRLLTWDRRQYLSDLTFTNNAWSRGPAVPYDSVLAPIAGSGGGFTSSFRTPGLNPPYLAMYSHGRDSVVQLREVRNTNGWVTGASLMLVHPGGTRALNPIVVPFGVGNSSGSDCWIRRQDNGDCLQGFSYVSQYNQASFSGAFSPMGDSLYIAVRRTRGGGRFDNWELCPTAPAGDTIKDGVPDDVVRECRPHITGQGTDSTWIYGVEIRSGSARQIWSGASAVEIWGVTEDGQEFVTRQESSAQSDRIVFYVFQPADQPYYEMRHRYVPYTSASDCGLQYRAAQAGTPTYVAFSGRTCSGLDVDAMGAPSVSPGGAR
jgi:hypothetical protein